MVSFMCTSAGPPSAPQNFKVVSILDDPRPEFYGYAVISLEWDPPEGTVLTPSIQYENYTMRHAPLNYTIIIND